MFYAKSIYLGGVIIGADEVDYNDYKKLGLRCLNCGEEVLVKHGDNKSSHFAHFKLYKKGENNQKICALRSSSYSLHSWRELTVEGKNQRRILFQQFFIDIISDTYHDFKAQNTTIEKKLFNNYVDKFKHHKKELISQLNTLPDNVFINKNDLELQKPILSEVIDYLTLPYTSPILSKVLNYCLNKNADLIGQETHDIQEDLDKERIILQIFMFLFKVDWVSHLTLYSGEKRRSILVSSEKKTKKITNFPLIFNETKLNIYIKTSASKYSKTHKYSFLDRTFNNYKLSLEPDLSISLHESFYRSKKLSPIHKKNQKIAEILEINKSILNTNQNKKVLNISWKIDKLYEEKSLRHSVEKSIFLQDQIEQFLSELFLSNFQFNFVMQESENMHRNRLLYYQQIKKKQEIDDESIRAREIAIHKEHEHRDKDRRLSQERSRLSFALTEIVSQKVLSTLSINKQDLYHELSDLIDVIKMDYKPEFKNNKLIVKCPFCLEYIDLKTKNHFTECMVLRSGSFHSSSLLSDLETTFRSRRL